MSIEVRTDELADAMRGYPYAYVLSIGDDGRPHATACSTVSLNRDTVVVAELGGRTLRNLAARPDVTLLWPPPDATGYSLILDGTATVGDGDARVEIQRAVLHRPAGPQHVAPEGACGADCVPLTS